MSDDAGEVKRPRIRLRRRARGFRDAEAVGGGARLLLAMTSAELLRAELAPGRAYVLGEVQADRAVANAAALIAAVDRHLGRAPASTPAGGVSSMEEVEREAVRAALVKTGGHRAEAATLLGIGERTLYRKLEEYELWECGVGQPATPVETVEGSHG